MLDKPKAHARAPRRATRTPAQKAPPEVFALSAWSVKKVGDNWHIAHTACFDNKPEWSRPYATLYRATTAIARKLAEEVLVRQKRRQELDNRMKQ
jgi:hypothetical protein